MSSSGRLMALVLRGVVVLVMVERAIAGIGKQLQHGVRMRVVGAGAHLHGQEEKQDQAESPEDREEP